MGGDDGRVKLLCTFGGEFVREEGNTFYFGGKTRLVSIDRRSSFRSLLTKMAEVCGADPSSIDIKFQLPDESFDSRLISVESDEDVRNMIDEFDPNQKITIFLFSAKVRNLEEDDEDDSNDDEIASGEDDDDGNIPVVDSVAIVCARETATPAAEELLSSQSGPSTSATYCRRDDTRNSSVALSMSREMFRRESQSLVVGQEYEDVQTLRNALTSAAIAGNFELHMLRSDQKRVTARCAAEGCTWRVHASRLVHGTMFRIRTLTPEHTCERSGDAGHRQANAKWIASCIKEKLRRNRNYKPRDILNDIRREYGVLITYKRAFLAREKALEELLAEPGNGFRRIGSNYEAPLENSTDAWGEIHDPPRKRRVQVNRPSTPKEFCCTRCHQSGHNRRTCTAVP